MYQDKYKVKYLRGDTTVMERKQKQGKGLQAGPCGKQSTRVLRGQPMGAGPHRGCKAVPVLLTMLPAGLNWSGTRDAANAKETFFLGGGARQLLS